MFHVIGMVAGKYGVLDTDDGGIEWIKLEDLQKAVKLGISVGGYGEKIQKSKCSIPMDKCNWANGQNIFAEGSKISMNVAKREGEVEKGSFQLKTNGKTMKGNFKDAKAEPVVDLVFYGCVLVKIPRDVLRTLL